MVGWSRAPGVPTTSSIYRLTSVQQTGETAEYHDGNGVSKTLLSTLNRWSRARLVVLHCEGVLHFSIEKEGCN